MMTNSPNLRALFKSFGMGENEASMAIQSAFFIPRTTDPDAQVTIQLVKSIQQGLNELGANIYPNGILGPATMKHLQATSGPLWHGKPWWELFSDIAVARESGRRFAKRNSHVALEGLGDTDVVGTALGLGVVAILVYQAFQEIKK